MTDTHTLPCSLMGACWAPRCAHKHNSSADTMCSTCHFSKIFSRPTAENRRPRRAEHGATRSPASTDGQLSSEPQRRTASSVCQLSPDLWPPPDRPSPSMCERIASFIQTASWKCVRWTSALRFTQAFQQTYDSFLGETQLRLWKRRVAF